MTDNFILESLQKFMLENVSPKIKLQVPNNDNIQKYNLIHPNVFIGWLPPPSKLQDVPEQTLNDTKIALPAIIVGFDEGNDDDDDAGLNIRLVIGVYNPATYMPNGDILFNTTGYQDLVNLMHLCRQELISSSIIEDGITEVHKPFKWGIYPDTPIPYWFGWVTFKVSAVIMPPVKTIVNFSNI